ncbi:MAG: carbon-nitrogen hydrolase family protein [Acidobacteria bacterium]|nr:carbon-nitrogen hydrolase family protein [Acidobacteriota bacterium]MBI3655558.1 carbon-nitrogen hydrolase family protein [Acidobacteriota bacterium]
MHGKHRVAAIQLTSTDDWANNLETAEGFIHEAADQGAELVGLPENFAFLRADSQTTPCGQTLDGEFLQRMATVAQQRQLHILCGSIPERIADSDLIYNTSVLLGPCGDRLAVYRKIHLFDVNLPGGAVFQESRFVRPGNEIIVIDTRLGKIGLTICYDLRFPEIYRRLTQAGAEIIFVPSAFTEYTGKDHWEVLLRARAIENLAYIVAPAQYGQHNPTRRSYGKSMIIDPWGNVIARASDKPGPILAEIDYDFQSKIRQELPCLNHIRL